MQPKKQGLGAKIKGMFGGKKNKAGAHGAHGTGIATGGQVIEEHVHTTTTTTTTTLNQGAHLQQGHHHLHGPLVANPYAQPAHGQIFVPANTAVSANPDTGALLPASSLNGPVILPTGPKVIPIGTNYPAGQAGPMVIPPSGGFINNSGNPYLTQQSYGPSGVLPTQSGITETHYRETDYVDTKGLEKEQKRLEKEDMKRHKAIEKEEKRAEKDEARLQSQLIKDQEKLDRQLAKDQEKIIKDQQRLETTLEKDQARLQNNQVKLENKLEKNEAKLENKLTADQMRLQEVAQRDAIAHQNQGVYTDQHVHGAPLTTGIDAGAHGVKHVFAEETKQDAFTGQVLDHNVYHKDSRF